MTKLIQRVLGEAAIDPKQYIRDVPPPITYEFKSTYNGRQWVVRLVPPGDLCLLRRKYGKPFENTTGHVLVEFYDATYDFDGWGQYVTNYFADSLMADKARLLQHGLDLMGHEPAWKLSSDDMIRVFHFIDSGPDWHPQSGAAPTDFTVKPEDLPEAYAGFDSAYLNSNQPLPRVRATVYRTLHQPWAIESARAMRDKYGINVWVDGTVTTGWKVVVHAADADRARRMFLSTLTGGAKIGIIPGSVS